MVVAWISLRRLCAVVRERGGTNAPARSFARPRLSSVRGLGASCSTTHSVNGSLGLQVRGTGGFPAAAFARASGQGHGSSFARGALLMFGGPELARTWVIYARLLWLYPRGH